MISQFGNAWNIEHIAEPGVSPMAAGYDEAQ
jgi:hypothetical protein